MKRNNAGDLDAAKANLERALAIDDSYMPAFNQMALYHLTKKNFELAALVATQAIQKNGAYAPIHNTAGLVQIQLGRVNLAVQFFQQAMRLDPSLFEAPMNFARVNLSVRGFEPAEKAFRRALAIRPNDYDAHLGLALALRGQITSDNATQQISAVRTELDACKKIDASRPDAYYNEGILIAEFEAKTSDHPKPALVRAIASFEAFKTRAASKPEYAVTAKSADDRIHDAETTIAFLP
jgi:Tfp pilus assembly protein PilF